VLRFLEAKESSLLSGCAVAGPENAMVESYPDVKMLESSDPTENDGWLRRGYHHPGEGSDEAEKDHTAAQASFFFDNEWQVFCLCIKERKT
jgi:hypothetical protein